jgi:hypothetical protein
MTLLTITGASVGTIDLNDGSNCELLPGWRPVVARRQRSGQGPLYEYVVETIPLRVFGADPLGWLHRLAAALDEAEEKWSRGAGGIVLNYKPNNSTLATALQTPLVGLPEGAGGLFDLPVSFNQDLTVKEINPVRLQLKRGGAWLGAEETRSRTNGTINNPGVMTPSSNFTDTVTLPSPYEFSFTLSAPVGAPTAGMLLCARSSSFLKLLEGEDGSGTNFTGVSLGGTESGGDVGRYSPADTNPNEIEWTITGLDTGVRRLGIVINLQNNSSTVTYRIRAKCETGAYSRMRIVGTSDNDPQVFLYGIVVSPYKAITSLILEIKATATAGAGNSLDIDTIGIVALDNDAGNIIALHDLGVTTTDPIIDHASLTAKSPIVRDSSSNGKPYSGNAFLNSLGNTAAFLMLANTSTEWNITDGSGGLLSVGFSMARRPAYLIPR